MTAGTGGDAGGTSGDRGRPTGDERRVPAPGPAPLRAAFVRFLGLVVVTAAIAVVAWRFLAIDATSHSASDTLRPWLLQAGLVAAVTALLLVAVERSRGRRDGT